MADGDEGQDEEPALAEQLVALDDGEWVVLVLEERGEVEAFVDEIDIDADALTGVATRKVRFDRPDGCPYMAVLHHDAHTDDATLSYALAYEGDDDAEYVALEAVRESDQSRLATDGGQQERPRPAAWPESFSAAGEDPSCPHQLMWDDAAGEYRCIYGCGRRAEAPPDRLVDDANGGGRD